MGNFETKSDAYHYASIGLILLQELTFWRSASKVGAYEVMCSLDGETERELTILANAAAVAHPVTNPPAFEDGRELMRWTSEHEVRINRKKKMAGYRRLGVVPLISGQTAIAVPSVRLAWTRPCRRAREMSFYWAMSRQFYPATDGSTHSSRNLPLIRRR